MKKATKTLLLMLCAVVLVVSSILGTVAYLTSTASVENTFSVGNVTITMDEAKVNEYGEQLYKTAEPGKFATAGTDKADRVAKNDYKLIPGREYIKDPVIYVAAKSEPCWLFVKVENKISAFEKSGDTTIAKQLENNGWKALDGVTNVYYHDVVDARTATENVNVTVFEKFVIADKADTAEATKTAWAAVTADTKITVTAYAVQENGFEVKGETTAAEAAKAAWVAAGF